MHEILGSLLYCVEKELEEWASDPSPNPLRALFSPQTVEAHSFWLFERLMLELEPIYDPVPTSSHGVESQPFVVQYCVKIQGTSLT